MIGLMDCNNFFVSCERLFRPDLLGKPVAVLSSNDGCVVARSQEVKDLGVTMGVPVFEIKELISKEKVTLFSSNFALYRDISTRVMSALKAEFDTCEVYSVDEAFFAIDEDVTEETLKQIRARIMQKTGIPVSIGVAETKTLAKVANGIAKKGSGVCILDKMHRENTISSILCGSIWGIGRQTSASLSKMKIYTVGDLLAQDTTFIRQSLGVVGERICLELKGVSVYKIGDRIDEEQKSYMSTRSFGKPIHEKATLKSALGYHIAHLAEKLRYDSCVASKITIIMRASRFGPFAYREGSASVLLPNPTNDTFALTAEVSRLFNQLYDIEIPYKKAGVILSSIEPEGNTTSSLFKDSLQIEKMEKLNDVNDAINSKFGSATIRQAVTMGGEKWKERKNLKSPEYTTQWSEIACIKAT